MDEALQPDPLEQVLDRIEAAVARIEAFAGDSAALKRRHADLKASVARSLDGIDALLAAQPAARVED